MKYILLLFVILCQKTLSAQIINSMSPNKTGMYYYALDSVLHIVKKIRPINRVILVSDDYILNIFPDTIQGIGIVKEQSLRRSKKSRIKKEDILIRVGHIQIISSQITIRVDAVSKRSAENLPVLRGVYVFYFKYQPETEDYKLRNVKKRTDLMTL